MLVASTFLVALSLGAGAVGSDPAEERPRAAERSLPPEASNAERVRAGLLPRKSSPPNLAPSPPRRAPATVGAAADVPANAKAEPAAPAPAVVAVEERPAADTVAPLFDVVIAAMRTRSPPPEADDERAVRGADTSVESLRVRIRGAHVESLLVGRVAGLTVSVKSGGGAARDAGGSTAPAQPQPAARAPASAPASAPAAAPSAAPTAASPRQPASLPERADLLSRVSTPAGDVVERTVDASGLVTERRIDRTGRIVAENVVDVSTLKLVSQRRDEQGRILQVVEDTSGAFIGVMRDPIGRLLQAWVLRRR